tara:strand:- start:5587 stop:5934 length:348 start_codon:yes stop_codon:yes gene_type:complete
MDLQLQGRIKLIGEIQEFDSGFTKREFIVTTAEQYPQDIKLEFFKEKVADLDKVTEGQEVTVHFNIRGNEFNGKYYVNLQAWKLVSGAASPAGKAPSLPTPPAPLSAEDDDDLPF